MPVQILFAHLEMAPPLALLHAGCFEALPETPWSESALRALLKAPGHQGLVALASERAPAGFMLSGAKPAATLKF